MSARSHLIKLALAALVAASLTACPGGTTETTTPPPVPANPRAGVISQIDQLCADLYKKQQNIMWPDGSEEVGRYWSEQADAASSFVDKLEDIEVPEEGNNHFEDMLEHARTIVSALQRRADAASGVNAKEVSVNDDLGDRLVKEFTVSAVQYGLTQCADPRPARIY